MIVIKYFLAISPAPIVYTHLCLICVLVLAAVPLSSIYSHLCASKSHFLFFFLFQVKSLVFDQSGTYLAVGGSDIRVYICKQWSEVLNFTGEGEDTNLLNVHSVCISYGVCSEEVANYSPF